MRVFRNTGLDDEKKIEFLIGLVETCFKHGLNWIAAFDLLRWTDEFVTERFIYDEDCAKRHAQIVYYIYKLPKDLEPPYTDPPVNSTVCPRCGRTSHHPEDVKQRYCGNCHRFYDRMPSTPMPLRHSDESTS